MDALPKHTPRWLYRIFAFIEGLPLPPWQLALLYILVSAGVLHLAAWSQGIIPFGVGSLPLFTAGLLLVSAIGPWHFLTVRARPAIRDFFKGQRKSPAQIKATLEDFISLPPFWAALIFLSACMSGYFSYYRYTAPLLPISGKFLAVWILLNYMIGSGFLAIIGLRVLRQAVLMRRLYRETDVDIFNPAPIYALSRYAVVSIISLLLVMYSGVLLVSSSFQLTTSDLVSLALVNSLLLLFFFGQLLGVNQRMRRAKERLLTQLGVDLKDTYHRIHIAVGKRNYSNVDKMRGTLSALKDQQDLARKFSTWPWQPDTLRNLLTPMLIPVIIYLMQRYLGALLGF